ncbi:hypothetical protein FDECE_14139 [Fusarium decemcellulare]|nr:hypothetical protein FDECE_14139 [Fusarium decemcellulare]
MNEKIKKRIRCLLAKRNAQEPPQREHQEPIVYPIAPNDPIFFVSLDEMTLQKHLAAEAATKLAASLSQNKPKVGSGFEAHGSTQSENEQDTGLKGVHYEESFQEFEEEHVAMSTEKLETRLPWWTKSTNS